MVFLDVLSLACWLDDVQTSQVYLAVRHSVNYNDAYIVLLTHFQCLLRFTIFVSYTVVIIN